MATEENKQVVNETPTVALWAVVCNLLSDLSPYTVQVPSAVSKFLCRGADLMRAGMRSQPKVKMCAICVQGNSKPFAVGLLKNPDQPIELQILLCQQ